MFMGIYRKHSHGSHDPCVGVPCVLVTYEVCVLRIDYVYGSYITALCFLFSCFVEYMHVFTCVWALHVFTSLGLPYFSVYTGSYLDEQPKTKWLWIQAHTQTHHTSLASTLPMCAFVPALLRCPVLSVKPVWLRAKQTLRWTSSVDNVHSKRSNLP